MCYSLHFNLPHLTSYHVTLSHGHIPTRPESSRPVPKLHVPRKTFPAVALPRANVFANFPRRTWILLIIFFTLLFMYCTIYVFWSASVYVVWELLFLKHIMFIIWSYFKFKHSSHFLLNFFFRFFLSNKSNF